MCGSCYLSIGIHNAMTSPKAGRTCLAHSGMVEAQAETKSAIIKLEDRIWKVLIGVSGTLFLVLINIFITLMKTARAG